MMFKTAQTSCAHLFVGVEWVDVFDGHAVELLGEIVAERWRKLLAGGERRVSASVLVVSS